jgi:hypothetical protein
MPFAVADGAGDAHSRSKVQERIAAAMPFHIAQE